MMHILNIQENSVTLLSFVIQNTTLTMNAKLVNLTTSCITSGETSGEL